MATTGKKVQAKVVATSADTYIRSVDISVDVDTVDATAANATAKANVAGIYGWNANMDLNWTGSSGQIDDVLFKTITSGAQNLQVLPGGGTNASDDNPMFRGNAIMKSFSISSPHDGLITEKASWVGDGALTRVTSGSY